MTPRSIRGNDGELPSGASTPRTPYAFSAQNVVEFRQDLPEFLHPMFYEWLRERQLVHPDSDCLTPNRTRINPRTVLMSVAMPPPKFLSREDSIPYIVIGLTSLIDVPCLLVLPPVRTSTLRPLVKYELSHAFPKRSGLEQP